MRGQVWYFCVVFTACCLITACVGGTLSNQKDLEEYPLRPATKSEATGLKHCLKSLHGAEEQYLEKNGSYSTKLGQLSHKVCDGDYKLRMRQQDDGYEIEATLSDDESKVRWTINQEGTIEEYLEPEEVDLEF